MGVILIMRRSAALLALLPLLSLPAEPPGKPVSTPEGSGQFEESTTKSEKAVRKGTDWLLKTFNPDGGCGTDLTAPTDIACTAMVGLALLSQGNTPLHGVHSREVRRILLYILEQVDHMPLDDITPRTDTQVQVKIGRHAHSFFAALFLSQALGEVENQERVRKALRRLVGVIERAQKEDGTWGAESWAPVLGTVMGWSSLRASHSVGFPVKASIERTQKKLVEQMDQQAQGWMQDLYKNASGLRVLWAAGKGDEPVPKKVMASVLHLIATDQTPFTQAGGEEFLAFHLLNECLLQAGGEKWRKWFPNLRDRLVQVQNEDGSWAGHHCITSRTFCTAAALLVLASPNRYLPISQK